MNANDSAAVTNENELNQSSSKPSINKAPAIKKPKLVSKPDHKNLKPISKQNENDFKKVDRVWEETKVYYLPLMPTDNDEKDAFIEREYRCSYCDELCDEGNLECKVCSKVFHLACLFKRGHLNSLDVPLKIEWTCSDCSDLSKCLSDEEIRRIINIYDELDFRKNCYVNFNDYMKIKKNMYEQLGEQMSQEKINEETKRFRLMDKDKSGSITWHEFVEFEAANLLAKKNKVELSNHLSLKELIVAKKMFLTHDKENLQMILREDAKKCYLEYIHKLRRKLGPAFSEHISNCAHLFDLNSDGEQKTNSAKTIWPEFIRKITILLLYDRINSKHFIPKYWKPGIWFSILSNEGAKLNKENSDLSRTVASSKSRGDSPLPPIFGIKSSEVDNHKNNNQHDMNGLLKPLNKESSMFKPYAPESFGSYEYVIRSKRYAHNDSNLNSIDQFVDSEDDEDDETKHFYSKSNKLNHKSHKHNKTNRVLLKNPHASVSLKLNHNENNFENSTEFFVQQATSIGTFNFRTNNFNSRSSNQFDLNRLNNTNGGKSTKQQVNTSKFYQQPMTSMNYFNYKNQPFTKTDFKEFHLPELVEDRIDQHTITHPTTKNRYLNLSNSITNSINSKKENVSNSERNIQINSKYQNELNFVNKIINSSETNKTNLITNLN